MRLVECSMTAKTYRRAPVRVRVVGSAPGAVSVLPPIRFPEPPARTRRATLTASGAPRVLPGGQPLVVAGFGVHGVVMVFPR